MANGQSQRWHELWLSASNANDDDNDNNNNNSVTPIANAGDWEDTINSALARMLENGTPVERAIAARLLLAESYLGRLYREGPDEITFGPEAD